MKSKRVLRYYCEYCKKSGCGKAAMRTHETHCTNNPDRLCRMCAEQPRRGAPVMEYKPSRLKEMVECVRTNPPDAALKEIREIAEGCPACILAAIRQGRSPYRHWFEFDFKTEAAQYLNDKHESP